MKLDKKDEAILTELQKNSQQTTSKLSKKLNIPITTVHNRIKKLEREGVIQNYTLTIDHKKLGKQIRAVIGVTVDYQARDKRVNQTGVAKEIKKIAGVTSVQIMTGGSDILIEVLANDIDELNGIVTEKLRNIAGVDKTQTSIVLKEV